MEKPININSRVIEKCLQGDIKAQFHLYKQYSKAMYNIAIRFMGNKMDAEDILQESFATAFKRLHELENRDAFAGWLKRIVINKCISCQRKKRIQFDEIDELRLPDPFEADENFPEIDPAVVHNAIKVLPDKARAVLVLRALEGYKHSEISEMLGISVSTSKTQYSRALGLLREKLKENSNVE